MTASGAVPPFWLRPTGTDGHAIDARVTEVAERHWRFCWSETTRLLADGARVEELVEEVAMDVSHQLEGNPRVGDHLSGYFITSFKRRLSAYAGRDRRVVFIGFVDDCGVLARRGDDRWLTQLEARITLDQLLRNAPLEVRQILWARLLDWSWENIAAHLGVPKAQAKTRFYRGLREAYRQSVRPRGKGGDG